MKSKLYLFGGGISSASTAFYSNSTNIQVLEKQNKVGGRIKSVKLGRDIFEAGAQFFTEKDRNVESFLKKLKLDNKINEVYLSNLNISRDNSIISLKKNCLQQDFDTHEISILYSYINHIDDYLTNSSAKNLMSMSLKKWYNTFVGRNDEWFIDALVRSLTFSNIEKLSAYYGLIVISTFFSHTYNLKNGLIAAVDAAFAASSAKISYNANIESIAIDNNISKVVVNGKEIQIDDNDYFVSGLPANILCKLVDDNKLKKALNKIEYANAQVFFIETKKKLLKDAYGIMFPSGTSPISIIVEETKGLTAKNGNGQLVVIFDGKTNVSSNEALEITSNILPVKNQINSVNHYNWDGALPICTPELFEIQNRISKYNYKNFSIAGDFMGLPSLDAAIESGHNAANNYNKFVKLRKT
ncbi:MAG: FAD-dependent oxidoreductase [Candidatus Iainarchaeum archaeon]|uniref:FAD-dependent oxidoreductase n=1 Tax=Candidatus Iainarchaeum sp. TaxID=3101447 RepID=A0A7T9DJL7_9ARCH|nr:MAG: FAD-dependent oxidoreductase [Candidatus Diapherotrites archaeon]